MELDTQPNAIIIIKTGFSKCKDGKYRNKLWLFYVFKGCILCLFKYFRIFKGFFMISMHVNW
jgi:hypothetical protein